MASASSWSWVTKRVVVPTSSWMRRISSRSCDAHLGVEGRQRLVEQQHRRLDRQRAGQGDALLLAAGQLAGVAVGVLAEADQLEHLAGATLRAVAAVLAAQLEPEGDVVEHGQVREQAVGLEDHPHVALVRRDPGDVLAAHRDGAGRRLVEAGEDPQRGGLAAARRAEQGDQLAGLEVQGEPVEGARPTPYTRVRSVSSTARPRSVLVVLMPSVLRRREPCCG